MKLVAYNSFVGDLCSRGIAYAAERAARLGFDAVETLDFLPSNQGESIDRRFSAEELRHVLEDCGLSAACHSVAVRRLDRADERTLDEMYRHIEFAARLGAPYLHHTLILPLKPIAESLSYEEALDAVLPWAERIADRCMQYGLTCLYEPQGLYFNGVKGLAPLLTEMRRRDKKIGICGDLGNSLFVDDDPLSVVTRFAKEIRHVHVKDYRVSETPCDGVRAYPTRGGKYLAECEIGEGDIDLFACFFALRTAGYTGDCSLEIDGDDAYLCRAIETVRALME